MELFLGLVERLLRSPIYVQRAFLAFTVAMFASCAARVSQAAPAPPRAPAQGQAASAH
jgi:hypothetical protein